MQPEFGVEQIQKLLKDTLELKEIPGAQRRSRVKPLAYYQADHQTRKIAMAEAYATADYTMNEIADYLKFIIR